MEYPANYNLIVTPVEAELVIKGLRKMPMEVVEEVVKKLVFQLSAQLSAVNTPPAPPAEPAAAEAV